MKSTVKTVLFLSVIARSASDVAISYGYATRLLLEEKLAFARYEQMTDVV